MKENQPTTKPSNPLKDAVTRAYRKQHGRCWNYQNCKSDISTGYYIEHLIDEIVVLSCECCKGEQYDRRVS